MQRWIVTAEATKCLMISIAHDKRACKLVRSLGNPLGRQRVGEFNTDEEGRSFRQMMGVGTRSAVQTRHDAHQQNLIDFSRRIGEELNAAFGRNELGEFVLVAPPKMAGLIREHLTERTASVLRETIVRDFGRLSLAQIAHRVAPLLNGWLLSGNTPVEVAAAQ